MKRVAVTPGFVRRCSCGTLLHIPDIHVIVTCSCGSTTQITGVPEKINDVAVMS